MRKSPTVRALLGSGLAPFSILIIFLVIASCRPSGPASPSPTIQTDLPVPIQTTQTIPVIVTQLVTATPPSPTAECASLPPGMSLVVTPISHFRVRLDLSGFPPGKDATFVFTTASGTNINRAVTGPIPVKPDGSYILHENLTVYPDRPNIHWQVQVLYSGGAACTAVDVP